MRRATVSFALCALLSVSVFATTVEAGTQRLGDECNWTKNCQSYVEGAGPGWANGEVTCAVPQDHAPESCGSGDKKKRNKFYG